MSDYEDARADELEDQGVPRRFSRMAMQHLKEGGMDDQGTDISAYYDSDLSYQENKELFRKSHPISNIESTSENYNKAYARHMDVESYKDRAGQYQNAEQERFEQAKSTPWNPKYNELPGAKRQKKAFGNNEGTMEDQLTRDLPDKSPGQPSFVDKIMGKYHEIQGGFSKRSEANKRERLYNATNKAQQLKEDINVGRAEARVRMLQKEMASYEKMNSRLAPLANLRDSARGMRNFVGGGGMANAGRRYGGSGAGSLLFGQGGGGTSSRFSGGGSGAMSLLTGGGVEQHRRHNYVTVMKGNKVVQVDMNDPRYAQGGVQPQREASIFDRFSSGGGVGWNNNKNSSGIGSMLFSNSRGGMKRQSGRAAHLLFGSRKKGRF